jgi:Flp pilus assembly protein TadG
MRRGSPWRDRESGQSLVETALMIIVIFTVIFSIFEICQLMYTYTVLADAANEGVRYAVVRTGIVTNDPNVQEHVRTFARLSMHNVTAMTVNVTLPDTTSAPTKRVQVSVSYSYIPFIQSFMRNPPTLHAFAEGRMIAGP